MMAALDVSQLRGDWRENEPMARHCSWRAGGRARYFYQPADIEDLQALLMSLPDDENILCLGLGSNLLVRDGGFDGTVISLKGRLSDIKLHGSTSIYAEAGVSCAKLARFAARNGLIGAEFFSGIPGTIGGVLKMNAGAFHGETWAIVNWVEILNLQGEKQSLRATDFEIGYRHVEGPEGWFVAAEFDLLKGDVEAAQKDIRLLLEKRNASQPIGEASCGSVFRNPPGDYAARLIEVSGLKGLKMGGASVSSKHANFIINQKDATAAEIEALLKKVQQMVLQQQGVLLQPEVHIVGDPA